MKIKKIKWKDHPVLGSLELDFMNPATSKPYDIVLFAGENGVGKTSILEGVSTFLNGGSFEHFEHIEYFTDEGKEFAAVQFDDYSTKNNIQPCFYSIKTPLETDLIGSGEDLVRRYVLNIKSGKMGSHSWQDENENHPINIRINGCVLSKARADFQTKPIQSITTRKLDTDKGDLDADEDFTSLKQLLIDIENDDNASYRKINKAKKETAMLEADFDKESKMYRFKSAFNGFLENIQYSEVLDEGNEKKITFTKNGKIVYIDQLSTGEKQIVFRGAYLLRNLGNLSNSTIMIDEPELSMHPKWQEKALKYYTDLFTNDTGLTAQMFFATHSELVLQSALADKGRCLVVVLTNENGVIKGKPIVAPTVLPVITSAETRYLAFDVVSNDYHIELYGYLQSKTGEDTVKGCDTYITQQSQYDITLHERKSKYKHTDKLGHPVIDKKTGTQKITDYETLPTYIRNQIDHPDPIPNFTKEELRTSIKLLIELCK